MRYIANVRFGSLAVITTNTSLMTAFGGKAVVGLDSVGQCLPDQAPTVTASAGPVAVLLPDKAQHSNNYSRLHFSYAIV